MIKCAYSARKGGDSRMRIDQQIINTILAERGITKAEAAKNCGISRQNFSTIIRRGTCEPRTAGKLAAGLGVPVANIIKGTHYGTD